MKKMLLALLVLTATKSFATQYFIQCGQNHGLKYFPSTVTVSLGDTITWKGDFLQFPFKSTIIPLGAQTFGADDGSSFSYIPEIAGNYYYGCTSASFSGTKGEFTVASGSVRYPVVTNIATSLFVENQNGKNILHSAMTDNGALVFTISIFDMSGRMITSDKVTMDNSGFALPQFQDGIYIVRAIDEENNVSAIKIWQR